MIKRYQLDPYSILTKSDLVEAGVKNIRSRYWHDWNNQPSTLTFSATLNQIEALNKLDTKHIWCITDDRWFISDTRYGQPI